jgi:hypothetical protein
MDNLEPTYLLSGASSKEQLEQNIKAYSFKLERRFTSAKFLKRILKSTGKKMSCPNLIYLKLICFKDFKNKINGAILL